MVSMVSYEAKMAEMIPHDSTGFATSFTGNLLSFALTLTSTSSLRGRRHDDYAASSRSVTLIDRVNHSG
jgi:hypothetical protein